MLLNDRQLEATEKKIADINQAIKKQTAELKALRYDSESIKRGMAPFKCIKKECQEEIRRYLRLKNKGISALPKTIELQGLGKMLVEARIAKGLDQMEFAKMAGVKVTQVHRDEVNCYYGIAIPRANRILELLGLTVKMKIS